MTRRWLAVAAAVLALMGSTGTAAGQAAPEATTTLTRSDRTNDATNNRGPGDIVSLTVVHKDSVRLSTTTRVGADPRSTAAYQQNGSFVVWYLQLNDDPFQDANRWEVNLTGDGHGGLTGFFTHGGSNVACAVTRTYSNRVYTVKFARSCLGNPVSIRTQTRTFYRPAGVGVLQSTFDQCPDGSPYTGKLFYAS